MKKIIIPIILMHSILISCQKDTSSKLLDPSPLSPTTLIVSLSDNDIVGVDLTGFPLLNLCTGQIWKTLSGTIALNLTSEGNLKSLGIYNFAFLGINGTIYHGIYAASVESMWSDSSGNTYKLVCKPQGDTANYTFYALAKITLMTNGKYLIAIDSGAVDCH